MALEERTRPYETVVRYNVDGSYLVSHRTVYEIYRADGTIVSQSVSEAGAIDGSDDSASKALQQALGEAAGLIVQQSDESAKALELARQDVADEKYKNAALQGKIDSLTTRAADAEARLEAVIQAARAAALAGEEES